MQRDNVCASRLNRISQELSIFDMLKEMFRISSIGKSILALLLPVTFIMSWAACESFCAEIAEQHHKNQTAASETHLDGENCLSLSDVSEGCQMTATAAVIEARQAVKLSALSAVTMPVLRFRVPHPAWSALLPEIKQNSPPKIPSAPLFVRLCTFRI